MASQSTARLVRLPREVLIRITSFLSTTDLCAVRLTCKDLEDSLLMSFAHEYFHKKQFMLSKFSLRTLIDIAEHPTFGPRLRHVVISTNHFQRPRASIHLASVNPRTPEQTVHMYTAFGSQFVFLSAGHDQLMLAHAFAKLSNLETVDIRDFNSTNRVRDDPAWAWTSYGSTTARQQTGVAMVQRAQPDTGSAPTQDYLSRIFVSVLSALGTAQARPTGLEVLARSCPGLLDCALHIDKELMPSILPVLANLKTLHLDLYFSAEGWNHHPLVPNLPDGLPAPALQVFLASTPNLTWLRLNFVADTRSHTTENFLHWLATPVSALSPTGSLADMGPQIPIPLKHLERLDLGRLSLHLCTLQAVVEKFSSSLRHLSLRRVTLVGLDGNGQQAMKRMWPEFFQQLVGLAPHLQALEVGIPSHGICVSLRHDYVSPQVLPHEFVESGGISFHADAKMSMDRFLRDLVQSYKDFETAGALEGMKNLSTDQEDDTEEEVD